MTKNRVALVFGLLAVVLVVGGIAFVWVRGAVDRFVSAGQQVMSEGRTLGQSITAAACVDSAFARYPRDRAVSIGEGVTHKVFLEGCLGTAAPSPELCSDAPAGDQATIVQVSLWARRACAARGVNDQTCPQLMLSVHDYCGRMRPRA